MPLACGAFPTRAIPQVPRPVNICEPPSVAGLNSFIIVFFLPQHSRRNTVHDVNNAISRAACTAVSAQLAARTRPCCSRRNQSCPFVRHVRRCEVPQRHRRGSPVLSVQRPSLQDVVCRSRWRTHSICRRCPRCSLLRFLPREVFLFYAARHVDG